MARTIQTQSQHDRIVQVHANTLAERGHTDIKADHIGHYNGAPNSFLGYRPDLTSYDQFGTFVITETETNDSVDSIDTIQQMSKLRSAANQIGAQLHLVVPESGRQFANSTMAKNGIGIDMLWHAIGD